MHRIASGLAIAAGSTMLLAGTAAADVGETDPNMPGWCPTTSPTFEQDQQGWVGRAYGDGTSTEFLGYEVPAQYLVYEVCVYADGTAEFYETGGVNPVDIRHSSGAVIDHFSLKKSTEAPPVTEPPPTTVPPPDRPITVPRPPAEEIIPPVVVEQTPPCQEWDPCWDCRTMGNLECGEPEPEPEKKVTALAYTGAGEIIGTIIVALLLLAGGIFGHRRSKRKLYSRTRLTEALRPYDRALLPLHRHGL